MTVSTNTSRPNEVAASALLARHLNPDALLLLADLGGVYRDFGTKRAARIAEITPTRHVPWARLQARRAPS